MGNAKNRASTAGVKNTPRRSPARASRASLFLRKGTSSASSSATGGSLQSWPGEIPDDQREADDEDFNDGTADLPG